MEKIIIISKCVKKVKGRSVFHFIGYLKGVKIKKVVILDSKFILGESYVIAINKTYINADTLYGEVIKYKVLFN